MTALTELTLTKAGSIVNATSQREDAVLSRLAAAAIERDCQV